MTCSNGDVGKTAEAFLARMQQAHSGGIGAQRGRDLMRSAGVDPDTARQALDRLVTRGLVEKVPGEPGAWTLTAEGLPAEVERPAVAPAVAPVSADRWDGTGPRWWPTTVARRPRYYPEPGKVPEKVLLAFESFPGGARPKDISAFMGQDVSNRISELMTYGVLVKDGHGLYRLATTPPAPTGSGPLSEAKPASEPAGEAGGGAGEATGGADLPPAVGTQVVVPTTAAEQALIAENDRLRREATACRFAAETAVVERDLAMDAGRALNERIKELRELAGPGLLAVRLLVQARDDETLEAAVVRHIAGLDHEAALALDEAERARATRDKHFAALGRAEAERDAAHRDTVVATATRDALLVQAGQDADLIDALCEAVGLPREAATDEAILKAIGGVHVWAVTPADGGLPFYVDAAGWRDALAGVAAGEAHIVHAAEVTTLAASKMHLDAIRKALAEGGEPANLSDLLLAPAVRALVKQVKSLEKVAQRQPVAPGPRLMHPLGHPAVTAATVAAVGKLCCDANAAAIDDLRDGLAIDDDADMAEVVAVVLASRKADHAAIAELRAELADTRRRLTLAQCDASAQRAKVERGLGQRLLAAIRRGVGA